MSSLAEQFVNLFTNPSFETAGTPVTLATNLLTNPSFETAGASVVVRTNLCTNPNFESGTTGWSVQNSTFAVSTAQHHSGAQSLLVTLTAAVSAGAFTSFVQTVGTVYTLSAWVFAPVSVTIRAAYTGATVSAGGTATVIPAGVWTQVFVTGTATATTGYLSVITTVAPAAGALLYVDDGLIEASPVVGSNFDYTYSPDPDLTPGGASGAVSTLSGVQPANVTGHGSVGSAAVQSSGWSSDGSKSVRVTAGLTSPDSFAQFSGLTWVAGATYTVIGTVHISAADAFSYRRALTISAFYTSASGSEANSIPAPAVPGDHEVRFTFTLPSDATGVSLRLYNGASAGSNVDVWWDAAAVVEGVYTGPAFNGSTPSADYLQYEWTDGADESTSIQVGTTVAAVTGGFQSTVWASRGSCSLFVPAGESATVPVAGLSTVIVTPQTAGQTVTFDTTPVTSADGNPITSTATGLVTFGPGYWDCLAIIAPGYQGPYFDGATPSGTTVDGISTYGWNGPADGSTSTMSILRYYTSNFNNLTFGPGTDIQLVEIDGLRSMKTRTSDQTYPEEDGALPGIDLLDERTLTYKLQIAAPQTMTVEDALQACASAFQVIRDPAGGLPLQVILPGWSEPRQLTARPINNDIPVDVNYTFGFIQFSVQFACADPLIYSTTQHTASTGLPSPTAGLSFNVTFPAAFGASAGGSVVVTNAGNYATRPVITITGPCINPYVSNGTDFMQFDISLAASDVLVIDMAAKSVVLNGSASRYNTVTTGSAWWGLAPGDSTFTFSSGDGSHVAATATVQWYDAWGMM